MKKLVLFLLVLLILTSFVFAEQVKVIMKDGKINEGELIGVNETTIFLRKDNKLHELSISDVKAVFNSETHKEIPIKNLQSSYAKPPAELPKPPAPQQVKPASPLSFGVNLEFGAPTSNTIKDKLWPMLVYEYPTTPWNGQDIMLSMSGELMYNISDDFALGVFLGGYIMGLGSQDSGVNVTGSYSGIPYTYSVEYDLPAGALMYGLKFNYLVFNDTNTKINSYIFANVGIIDLVCNYTMTVTSPYGNGNKRGTFEGSDTLMRVGIGLTMDNMYCELGVQNAKINQVTYTIDENDFFPAEVGSSGTLYDMNGEKIPADFSCVFINFGFRFNP